MKESSGTYTIQRSLLHSFEELTESHNLPPKVTKMALRRQMKSPYMLAFKNF